MVTCNECRPKKRKLCKQRTQDKNAAKVRCQVLEAENAELKAENTRLRLKHEQRFALLHKCLAMTQQVSPPLAFNWPDLVPSHRPRAGVRVAACHSQVPWVVG